MRSAYLGGRTACASERSRMTERPSAPLCPICGAAGGTLYADLDDVILGVADGTFDVAQCRSAACSTTWIHPTPDSSKIPEFYRQYFTHTDNPGDVPRVVQRLVRPLWPLPHRRREIAQLETFLVGDRPPGHLLELGCGAGERLARLSKMGWKVVGVELDPVSAERARSNHQIEVLVGEVEDLRFSPGQFDAVVSNHVLEHLPDPVRTMSSIVPLLRPGGIFVAVTPNVQSLGHRWFGRHWYGLDVPRHLILFSERSLRQAAVQAGLHVEAAWGTACRAEQVFTRSAEARWLKGFPPRIGKIAARIVGALLQAPATARCRRSSDTGEELVIVARRVGAVS